MKKRSLLFICLICSLYFIKAQTPEPGFVVFSAKGKVSATDGAQSFAALRKNTKLTCNAIIRIKEGSVILTHPAVAPITLEADGDNPIADRINSIDKKICSPAEPMIENTPSTYSKDKLRLNTALNGLIIPQKINVSWTKPKYENTFKIEIATASAPDDVLEEYETNDGDINIDLKKLDLEPGVEYVLRVKSMIKKIAGAEAKFRIADIDNYKVLQDKLKENEDFQEADNYTRELLEAFELERAGYNYFASEKYDKLMDKYETNSELKRLYKQFNARMGITRTIKK